MCVYIYIKWGPLGIVHGFVPDRKESQIRRPAYVYIIHQKTDMVTAK